MMTTKEMAIIWGGFVLIVLIVAGAITISNIYAPSSNKDALTVCATYIEARNSAFCMELARTQGKQEQPR